MHIYYIEISILKFLHLTRSWFSHLLISLVYQSVRRKWFLTNTHTHSYTHSVYSRMPEITYSREICLQMGYECVCTFARSSRSVASHNYFTRCLPGHSTLHGGALVILWMATRDANFAHCEYIWKPSVYRRANYTPPCITVHFIRLLFASTLKEKKKTKG